MSQIYGIHSCGGLLGCGGSLCLFGSGLLLSSGFLCLFGSGLLLSSSRLGLRVAGTGKRLHISWAAPFLCFPRKIDVT